MTPTCCEPGAVDHFAGDQDTIVRALEECARCPILATCRDGAIERGEQFGVWGGLNQSALRAAVKLHRKRARTATAEDGTDG